MRTWSGRAALTAAATLALVTTAAHAQRWEVGVRTGVSSSRVGDGEFDWSGSNGANGAFFRGTITERIAIQNELVMTRRSGVSVLPTSTVTLVAEYVELPLMLQLRMASWHGVAPFLSAGPSVTLRMRCRLRFVGGGLSTDDDCDDARYQTNTVDYAVNGGAGVAAGLGFITLMAEGRYSAGIRDNVLPTGVPTARASGWSAFGGASVPLYRARRVPGPVSPALPVLTRGEAVRESPPAVARVADEPAVIEDVMSRRISVDAVDVDVRDVLDGISRSAGIPIVVSPLVRGRVTIALDNVPLARALASIVDRAGFAMTRAVESGQWVVRVDPVPRGEH